MAHNAFKVYLDGNEVDTVFDQETDPEEVKKSLINHDGYNPDIEVEIEPVHTITDTLTALTDGREISRQRMESLTIAVELGADEATLITLRDALRVRRHPTMVLPRERLENLSRGRGWCRQGRGDSAIWGERHERGYEVGPGAWVVGGHDGFSRKGYDRWIVRQIQVGDQTWTVAD